MRTSSPLHLSMATWGLHWTTRHYGGKDRRKERVRGERGRRGGIVEDVDECERKRKRQREREGDKEGREQAEPIGPRTKYQTVKTIRSE